MTKRIVTAIMLCVILCSLFAIAFNVQTAKAQNSENPGYIPVGKNVEVDFDSIILVFDHVIVAGQASANIATEYPPPPTLPSPGPGTATTSVTSPTSGFFIVVWDVSVTAVFCGKVKIGIIYPEGTNPTQLWRTDVIPSDGDQDGNGNLPDVVTIQHGAAHSGSPSRNPHREISGGDHRIDPTCNPNRDQGDKRDQKNPCNNFPHNEPKSVWTNIFTYKDTVNHIIYGVTDHFSLFGVH